MIAEQEVVTTLRCPWPAANAKPVCAGDVVLAVRHDGMLVSDRARIDQDPGWPTLFCAHYTHQSTHVIGAYRTMAEAHAALEEAHARADRFGDANGLLHPVPWNKVALRLVHDGHGMVTLHPDDKATREFVTRRPRFFHEMLKSFPSGRKLTDDALAGLASTIQQRVVDNWREVGTGCRVEIGPREIRETYFITGDGWPNDSNERDEG